VMGSQKFPTTHSWGLHIGGQREEIPFSHTLVVIDHISSPSEVASPDLSPVVPHRKAIITCSTS
jgi:hypothetical protein